MTPRTPIDPDLIAKHNARLEKDLAADYAHLGEVLARRGVDLEAITARVQKFAVAIPSWGVGSGGTRFARFPIAGEPRNVFEKLEDCAVIQQLGRATPTVSPHFPWDRVDDYGELHEFANSYGLKFDAVNSNTFEDLPGRLSYKFGSLTHTDKAVRRQAIAHNLECIEIGRQLGSRALTVWIGDGSNFPGQLNLAKALERYLESMREIVAAIPDGWRAFIEHKLYEPALYSTVIADWGTSFICATQLGANVQCLVDLGHHAPTTNIEQIVARLIQFGRLGGFHFNDSKYGDDDLDTGSVNPFQIFLVFNELVEAELRGAPGFAPAYMLDQSHNVTDPIESLMESAVALQRAYVQASIVDRKALEAAQESNDALLANRTLQNAIRMDVEPAIKMARKRAGGAIDPVAVFRESRYRQCKASARPQELTGKSGIV
ncbi:MAG TPA: L-rhamnose catabolism isomerase [Patescibacteria group bacterium]|nr:L-rhamnose catabolism isomerase [Patescibacteria group bacterium]